MRYPKDILEKLYVLSRDIEYLLNSTLAKKIQSGIEITILTT